MTPLYDLFVPKDGPLRAAQAAAVLSEQGTPGNGGVLHARGIVNAQRIECGRLITRGLRQPILETMQFILCRETGAIVELKLHRGELLAGGADHKWLRDEGLECGWTACA